MPILGLGADLPEDSVLPWEKEADKKRQQLLALREKMRVQPASNKIGYEPYSLQQQEIVGQSAAGLRAAQGAAQGRAARAAADRQRAAEAAQRKAQEDLQKQYSDWIKAHPYQNQGGLTTQPGPNYNVGQAWGAGQQYHGSDVELAQLARAAGFPESEIPRAVAIALAESNGVANAVSGTNDHGLWQINQVHSGRPGFANVYDPLTNAKLAFDIWKDAGNSWSPWVTAQNGLEQKFMGRGQAAIGSPAYQQPWVTQPPAMANSGPTTGLRQSLVTTTLSALGTPYYWGGESLRNGVDCSGLVQQVYASIGIDLPHSANLQSDAYGSDTNIYGRRVPLAQLQPGDLVAWDHNRSGERSDFVGHIAVYIGNGQIVEAYQTGRPVHQRALRLNEEHIYGVHMSLPGDE